MRLLIRIYLRVGTRFGKRPVPSFETYKRVDDEVIYVLYCTIPTCTISFKSTS